MNRTTVNRSNRTSYAVVDADGQFYVPAAAWSQTVSDARLYRYSDAARIARTCQAKGGQHRRCSVVAVIAAHPELA